jgi:hypothetical protein
VETRDLVSGLGIAVFYDEINYGRMPKHAARRYSDQTFRILMLAKVFCVQMILQLGYNVLFQDVDVVWYKHPLDYFRHAPSDIDMFFQDDGNHAQFYAPYSANTGFYFVRHSDNTRHFFDSLLLNGDLILESKSHQLALIALLNEHTSLFGLRVKVFSRDEDDFPGGYQYNQKTGKYMRRFFAGKVDPYIFHMSWTHNKDNKQRYFQQMGEWYLKQECVQKNRDEIGDVAACCLAEPVITCHYRDKPSKIPCKDSPPIDKGRPSFW